MIYQQQISRSQPPDEEARTGTWNGASPPLAPGAPFVGGMTLPEDTAAGAYEHPQATVLEFDDHVFEGPWP